MKLARFTTGDHHRIFARQHGDWVALTHVAGTTRLTDLVGEARRGQVAAMIDVAATGTPQVRLDDAATIVDHSDDVWGAGLNYRGHSQDLEADQPTSGPGSYLRPSNCLIGNGQAIELPSQSERVTAEAELGLIIGAACKNVGREGWRSVVAGVTAVLDMTAEDVIRENPRYIPWAKGFDTFCSVGPQLVTVDEFPEQDLESVRVSTVRNGETVASAEVSDMRYGLGYLVEYFTAGRTLAAGTVICTGTPGAAVINPGDSIQAMVEGVGFLTHTVR